MTNNSNEFATDFADTLAGDLESLHNADVESFFQSLEELSSEEAKAPTAKPTPRAIPNRKPQTVKGPQRPKPVYRNQPLKDHEGLKALANKLSR